jgi:hypothetical protein
VSTQIAVRLPDEMVAFLDCSVAEGRRPGLVSISGEPFRQGREHGHGRFWPLLQYGV